MAEAPPRPPPALIAGLVATVLLCFFSSPALAKSSPRPITDSEIREKKNACYADIESGLWGWKCKSSMIEKENCALRCLSPVCYELVYESDPLEEGEKDFVRAQEYKYCMHKYVFDDGDCGHAMRAVEGDIGKGEATTGRGPPLNLAAKVLRSLMHGPTHKKLYTKAGKNRASQP